MSFSPDLTEYKATLAVLEPLARLVPVRVLRRALRLSHEQEFMHPHAVHDRCWRVARDHLFDLLTPGELGLSPTEPAAELLLLPLPDGAITEETWVVLWRTLFHAAVDRAFDEAAASGRIDPAVIRSASLVLGPANWRAIRSILTEENLVDEHGTTQSVVR